MSEEKDHKANQAEKTALMEKIVSLCKRRGFIYQSGELYGGLNGCWDYGPLGTELKRNLKDYWWRVNVQQRDDIVGLDGSILTHQDILKASGHVGGFSDPMVDCKVCKGRFRADSLDSMQCKEKPSCIPGKGPKCELTEPRDFNLMFQTRMGASSDESDDKSIAYLRPETAQSIFVQYKNVVDSNRVKIPFGIAQIGKSFRNEINPRNYTFRSREFEQMEVEYFCHPDDGMRLTDEWLELRLKFYEQVGVPRSKLHILDVPDGERAFYSKKTYDIEYEFPFGIQELEGVAYRTDYDLGVHQKHSGRPLEYFDEVTKEKYLPHVVEPSAGCDRTILAIICEAYDEETITDEKGKEEVRTVMHFHPRMAPVKCGIFPLLKNKPELVAKAKEVRDMLQPFMNVFYDEAGAIGRRYRRQDEIGTPYGVTIDFDTLGEEDSGANKDTVTIRERDSMKQERMAISELLPFLLEKIR
jgi:glycyl-tRNA synthetase